LLVEEEGKRPSGKRMSQESGTRIKLILAFPKYVIFVSAQKVPVFSSWMWFCSIELSPGLCILYCPGTFLPVILIQLYLRTETSVLSLTDGKPESSHI
jgi:hypothetical protein